MLSIERISAAVNRAVEYMLCFLGMVMVAVVGAQVFSRYVLNHSIFWSEELARFILVWLTFLGATVAYRRRAHAGIDIISKRLPPSGRMAAKAVAHLSTLFFSVILVYFGIAFSYFVRLQISPALYLPKWIPHCIIAVSGAILAIHTLAFLFSDLKRRGSIHDR